MSCATKHLQIKGIGKSSPRKNVTAPIIPKTIPIHSDIFSIGFKGFLRQRLKVSDNNISAAAIRK
jgi:hypothetical protein